MNERKVLDAGLTVTAVCGQWIMPKNKDKNHRKELLRGLYMISQIGFTITACVIVGVLLGRFLDSVFGTSPWLLLIFSLLGAGAGFKAIYELVKNK